MFGSDTVAFSATSTSKPGVTRNYASFSQAADENALSRIYIGYHFRKSIVDGKALGASIGSLCRSDRDAAVALSRKGRQRGYEKLTKRRRDGDVPLTSGTGEVRAAAWVSGVPGLASGASMRSQGPR